MQDRSRESQVQGPVVGKSLELWEVLTKPIWLDAKSMALSYRRRDIGDQQVGSTAFGKTWLYSEMASYWQFLPRIMG